MDSTAWSSLRLSLLVFARLLTKVNVASTCLFIISLERPITCQSDYHFNFAAPCGAGRGGGRFVTGARFSRTSDEITVGRCDFSPRSDRLSRRLSDFSSFLSSYLSLPALISLQARSSCQFFLTTLTLSFVVVIVLTLFHTVSFLCTVMYCFKS